ncbi:MAG: lysophospholipid acyltransferase family protein [Pyrinomonadaceae bacterium]
MDPSILEKRSTTTVLPRTEEPIPPTILNYLHSIIAIPLILLYTGIVGVLALLFFLIDRNKSGKLHHRCAKIWARFVLATAGVKIDVHGLENIQSGTSYVFASSHQSWMDIPVMIAALPVQLRIVAKKELFAIPGIGWHLRAAGHIAIDRSSATDAVTTLEQATAGIRDGLCAFIFPEGTRSFDGTLRKFKKGGFKLAMQSGVAVIPVAIVGTRRVMPRESLIIRARPVEIFIDKPVLTSNLSEEDLLPLINSVHKTIGSHFPIHQFRS